MEDIVLKGPQDYQNYFHTTWEGLVWLDGKGNPILVTVPLNAHVGTTA